MTEGFESVERAADAAANDTLTMSFDEYVDNTLDAQIEHFLTLADRRDVREINLLCAS